VAAALLAQRRQRGLGHVDPAEQVGLDLGAEVVAGDVLDGGEVGVAGVVDDHVEPSEPVDGRSHRRLGGREVGDVERERVDAIAVTGFEVVELLRLARGRKHLVARRQRRRGDFTLPQQLDDATADTACPSAGASDENWFAVSHRSGSHPIVRPGGADAGRRQ
jgi:hypothetical protein